MWYNDADRNGCLVIVITQSSNDTMYKDSYKHITHPFTIANTAKETGVNTGYDGEEDDTQNRKGGEW